MVDRRRPAFSGLSLGNSSAWRVTAWVTLIAASLACSPERSAPDEDAPPIDIAALIQRADTLAPDQLPIDSLIEFAEQVYFSGKIDSARILLEAVHRGAVAQGDVSIEARALTRLGLAAWRLGDYRNAKTLGEQALELKLQHGLTDRLFRSYNALGLLAWNEGRLTDAAELYEQAATVARETDDQSGTVAVTGNLALVRTELGEFVQARADFETMREGADALGDARMEGNALTNLGMLAIRIGNPRAAIRSLEAARALYDESGYITGEQSALGLLGNAYTLLGETSVALAALDSAYQQAKAQGLRQDEAGNLELMADLYREAGDHRRALQLLERAKEINAELGLRLETGANLRREAEIHLGLEGFDEATEYAREALAIHEDIGVKLEQLWDHLVLAELADRSSRGEETRRHVRAARNLADELDARIAYVELALVEARIADRNERAGDVLQILEQASRFVSGSGFWSEWVGHQLRSRAFAQLGRLEEAAEAGRLALAAVERVRGNYGSGVLRTSYAADKATVYEELVSVLLQLGRIDEAFSVADAARGRALVEHIASIPSTASLTTNLARSLVRGDGVLREIDQLLESIDYLESVPPAERDSAQLVEVELLYGLLRERRSGYESMVVQAAEAAGAGAALLGETRVEARDVQERLRSGEVLVDYLVTEDRLLLFVVTPTAVQSFASDISKENLVSRVRLARGLIRNSRAMRDQLREPLSGLHQVLIGPMVGTGILDGVDRLIVVPHGALNYLPFAALIDPTSGRYLVEDYALQFLPSAAALPAVRGSDGEPSRLPLGTTIFAPLPDDLPATRREARSVGRVAVRAELHVGRSASEAALREALERPGLVHVATHGVMNVGNPMFSRLEMAPTRGAVAENDGRLEVHELLQLSIRSSLVFLSGCETGIGPAWTNDLMQGEDYATLAQAFLYAGARNVIATLWAIDDEGAAAFAEGFYRRLGEASPTDALADVQRALISEGEFSSPYYWAAYQLAGNGML